MTKLFLLNLLLSAQNYIGLQLRSIYYTLARICPEHRCYMEQIRIIATDPTVIWSCRKCWNRSIGKPDDD